MRKTVFIIPILSIFVFFSCWTFKYDYIMEKFMEADRINFNHVKLIKIRCNNKDFSKALKDYILKAYRNRGLLKPKIALPINTSDGLSYEMNFEINKLDYKIKEGWKVAPKDIIKNSDGSYTIYHNNVKYWKTIDASVDIAISRTFKQDMVYDVTGDVSFSIAGENYEIKRSMHPVDDYTGIFSGASSENLAKEGLKDITNSDLFYGVIDKMLKDFFNKRLYVITREMISFKVGYSKQFFDAVKYLRQDRLDEALIVWEEIYADTDSPTYARGVAAYDIGMFKALEKDYDAAAVYFDKAEDLMEEGKQEVYKYKF